MSTLAEPLVSWTEFQRLPERPENGQRYELHDGEVAIVPPPRPLHIKLQKRIEKLLEEIAEGKGVVATEFPYRPVRNLQFWFANVACIPQADWNALPPNDYPVYAPPLIVEVLSPSNSRAKIQRQRIVAMSAGTEEFWVVDADKRTVQVTNARGTSSYGRGERIPVTVVPGNIGVDKIFSV